MIDDLEHLAADLMKAGPLAGIKAAAVVHRGANNIVRDARENAPKGPTLAGYPSTITYDFEASAETMKAEIGPTVGRQGSLGHLLENGVESRGLAPHPHVGPAFDREVPNFEAYMAEIGGAVL